MTELFGRDWRVQVGDLEVSRPLRIAFTIDRTARPAPNRAEIRLFHLGESSRGLVEPDAAVVVEAGYTSGRREIFRGSVLRARRGGSNASVGPRLEREKVGTALVIEATDGGRAFRQARVSRSYDPSVSVVTVLRDCAAALGVGEGNLSEVEGVAALDGGARSYSQGTALSGQASGEMTRILRSYGLRWSVQHGAIQVVQRGHVLQHGAALLSANTGLVGHPEVGPGGHVTARSKLSPDIWPGRRVRLEARDIQADLKVSSVRYEGDSHASGGWSALCELVPEAAA